jgi:hypothetical protein
MKLTSNGKLQEGLNGPLTLFTLSLYSCTYNLASLFMCFFDRFMYSFSEKI